MKPIEILDVLDLAYEARKLGRTYNPKFEGDAGLGKSEIVQQWVKNKQKENPDYGFIDIRAAYYEAPDMIGFPTTFKDSEDRLRTGNALPDFWPTSGEGLILLEEPNRASTSVLNTFMQLLTDRKVTENYELPTGWMIAAAVNQDSAEYDVNTMDTALEDRFEPYVVEYDHNSFIDYMESKSWQPEIVRYIKSAMWLYQPSDKIAEGAKYISPRTWSKLNNAMAAGAQKKGQSFHRLTCISALGKHIGNEFWKSCWDNAPVTAQDILNDKKAAFKRLKDDCKHDKNNSYEGDKITMTCQSIVDNYGGVKEKGKDFPSDKIDEKTMAEVALIIPKDQAINLIRDCGAKSVFSGLQSSSKVTNFFKDFITRHPKLKDIIKANIQVSRTQK